MFNGSTMSTVDRTCCIPITFSTGESRALDLFVTKITFCNPKTPPEMPSLALKAVDIQLVSKRTMGRICQEVGSEMFLLSPSSIQRMSNPFHTSPDWLEAKATSTAQPEDPLSGVPQEYHEFCDVFSGEKANALAPHWLYNLKINLEQGTKPFHALIYSLL